MNNKTLVIIGVGVGVAFAVGYLIGNSGQKTVVVTVEKVVEAKPDSILKRAMLSMCSGFGEGVGCAVGEKLTGAQGAQPILV